MDEFTIKLAPKPANKKISVFRLHKDDDVSWTDAKMKRENDYHPWQIKLGVGKTARRFKATKDGGVSENASYFIFYNTDPTSKTFEACPVDDWYSVSATLRYKTLTAEEAEEKFEQRHKMFNMFSVMGLRKTAEEGDESTSHDTKGFKVSELDEWDRSGDDEASDAEGGEGDSKRKVRRKKGSKKDEDAPAEGKEESDEGDFEEREVDYMSDSSSDHDEIPDETKDNDDVKGIAEEGGLRDLLNTDDEAEENAVKDSKSTQNGYNLNNDDLDENVSDESSESDDFNVDDEKMDSLFSAKKIPTILKQEVKIEPEPSTSRHETTNKSSQVTNTNKRKVAPNTSSNNTPTQSSKRPCMGETLPSTSGSSSTNVLERTLESLTVRYLSRRPMTLKNLLKDILSRLKKVEGLPENVHKNHIVQLIAEVIKRLKPDKEIINGQHYLSIKKNPQE